MATKKYVVTGDQALRIGNRLAEIQRQIFLQKEYAHNPEGLISHLQSATEGTFIGESASVSQVEVAEPKVFIPNLRSTAPTLADWLKAREELHKFFTGETVLLRDRFVFTDEELASTTLLPVFRPAGATNRMAVNWKKRMGVSVYEEDESKGGVMMYKNSQGLKDPELYLISRSVKPDTDTLGNNAKSPDDLVKVPNKLWLGLFGWCDADTLHSVITGKHLDPETWSWFPEDRLRGGKVADGCWNPGDREVCLVWDYADRCNPYDGARSAKKVPLAT